MRFFFQKLKLDYAQDNNLTVKNTWNYWLNYWEKVYWVVYIKASLYYYVSYSFVNFIQSGGCRSVVKSCPTLCDTMDYSKPVSSVLHYLLEFVQIHVHWVGNAI